MKYFNLLLDKLHLLVSVLTLLLLVTSPWLFMARKLMPANIWNLSHVYLGLVLAFLSLCYLFTNLINSKWRQYFPWLNFNFSPLFNDIKQLCKGHLPLTGGAGLFSVIEGLLILVLVLTGLTGFFWFIHQGTMDALIWRSLHVDFAHVLMVMLVMHFLGVASHLLELMR